jgi:hypothetical protein
MVLLPGGPAPVLVSALAAMLQRLVDGVEDPRPPGGAGAPAPVTSPVAKLPG